jgi:voltage-gated potassium channel
VRGIALARVLTAFNRGFRSLQRTIGRYGFGYVALLTLLVTMLGAAGMYAFERADSGAGQLEDFGDALWFTAMLMTTSGSDYWPISTEGRLLCFLLALYAFAIFGYVTATIAALLLGRERQSPAQSPAEPDDLAQLRGEIAALREELRTWTKR